MADEIANSDFDVNILENALTEPNLELSFPLPTDKETYLELETNDKVSNSFSILKHFIKFFSSVNYDDIYSNAEYKYAVSKIGGKFNRMSKEFMTERLENTDEKLDEIVYKLVDSELKMNLIKAKDFSKRFAEVKKFMIRYYSAENDKNLPKFGSPTFLKICYITVIKTVKKMFPQGVWVNREQLSSLYQKYLANPMSIILLPNHQSHIDYVMLHLILIRFQMSIPTVIAGENLNVAIFGRIMKGLGGIFIKRSFNNELYTERNLTNYVEFVLLNRIHFEVFIEGTRSRDGKLLLPKYGILKTLVSIYLKQRRQEKNENFDMLMQPISITYERIYEADGYLDELIGSDKKQESFVNILSNGLSNLVHGVDRDDEKVTVMKDGFVTNANRTLHGKIFVKLADSFTLSSYVEDPKNRVDYDFEDDVSVSEQDINLKKLGFKILHAINGASYLPECAIIGMVIQTFHYMSGKTEFNAKELLPMLDFLLNVYQEEDISPTNSKILTAIQQLNEEQKIALIKSQIISFFKFTRVNPKTNVVRIENSFELLYYKNLTIHLLIYKCLVSLILLKTSDRMQINKLFYIFTGFLKNEFLFDYNFNPKNNLSFILERYEKLGVISEDLQIKDKHFHNVLATIILPFIESFMICVDELNSTVVKFYANSQNKITEQQLISDNLMSKDYPTTKSLLKIIQKENMRMFERGNSHFHIETYNKQYLLSFLFYLNNLKLIKIFKNKSKTKAYVIIRNSRDLKFILSFLQRFIMRNEVDNISLNYMIDIVDKNFERDANEYKAKL
ncbi:uncharacterized protein CXQ87_004491 [Candidozyma duobushaemuli]|uniref:Phospholipid/glycerol acyltransferase domain-containing protein n=2 Tax=Candidozyma TaxID=3303203 RepID=A0ABX8IDZ1_9ASCO|nr:uncharacterized protein CXQ87_004491 [[Candida] duobushaemulonis]PVH16933.1 hypothetical protein CXQ87_004491 [[Candida] duobushaemulonis]QWU89713.1 hypothetical protein CA3LBN_004061 [[Candida] haemuloni]